MAFALSRAGDGARSRRRGPTLPGDLDKFPLLDSWIRIDADGHITVFTGKAELGQGLKTALIQVAADELAVPPAGIELITADTARTPDEGVTAGSHSMQDSGTAILNAAANVRVLLTEAAAWRWLRRRRRRSSCTMARPHGAERRQPGLRRAGGDAVAPRRGQTGRRRAARTASRLIGTNLPRVDIPAKVTGGAAYVQDMRLPGMLHARVVRGPSDGTRLKAADVDAVARMPGVVQVVREGGFTAVLADAGVASDQGAAAPAVGRLGAAGRRRCRQKTCARRSVACRRGSADLRRSRAAGARRWQAWSRRATAGPA